MRPAVTLIGLGPMGQAMARALLGGGQQVTVWNRTAGRADQIVAAGATLAATPADALTASELVVLSLTDYTAMYEILGDAIDALAGTVMVNLSSDTPQASRDAAAWAASHGAQFVTGGVMVPAPMIGTEASYVCYSGPPELIEAHGTTLGLIGSIKYVGADPGLAQLYYQAQLTVFLTTLSAILQGTALVASAGVEPADFVPEALATVAEIAAMIGPGDGLAASLASGVHPGDLSTVLMMGATADHIVGATKTAGVDDALPLAVKSQYDRAIAGGHGRDNWTSLYEVIKATAGG